MDLFHPESNTFFQNICHKLGAFYGRGISVTYQISSLLPSSSSSSLQQSPYTKIYGSHLPGSKRIVNHGHQGSTRLCTSISATSSYHGDLNCMWKPRQTSSPTHHEEQQRKVMACCSRRLDRSIGLLIFLSPLPHIPYTGISAEEIREKRKRDCYKQLPEAKCTLEACIQTCAI